MRKEVKNTARLVSVCGVMAAVAVVILFLTGITGFGTYAGPILASIALIPVMTEFGKKSALAVYAVVGVLSLMIMPDREMAVFWIIFAWYPMSLPLINKLKSRAFRIIVKLLIFTGMVALIYGVVKGLLGIPVEVLPVGVIVTLYILAGGAFLIMEVIYARIQQIWRQKYSKLIK